MVPHTVKPDGVACDDTPATSGNQFSYVCLRAYRHRMTQTRGAMALPLLLLLLSAASASAVAYPPLQLPAFTLSDLQVCKTKCNFVTRRDIWLCSCYSRAHALLGHDGRRSKPLGPKTTLRFIDTILTAAMTLTCHFADAKRSYCPARRRCHYQARHVCRHRAPRRRGGT